MDIRVIRQAVADNAAKVQALKSEGRTLLAVKTPTDEQSTRLTAINAELDTLTAEAATLAGKLAMAERFADDERKQGHPPVVELGKDLAETKPWGPTVAADATPFQKAEARQMAFGTFAQAVRNAALGQVAVDPRLFAAATGAGTQSDSNLGFAIPKEIAPGIEREMFETGELLKRVDARTISGNTITYNIFNETSRADGSRGGGVLGYWVDEGVAPTATNMSLAKIEQKLRKVGAFGVMTDELLSDAVALGGELEAAFADELIFQVENKIWRGNGANAPQGFTQAACLVSIAKESGQSAATIENANLLKMWARFPARSKRSASSAWFVNAECGPQLNVLSQAIGTGGIPSRIVNYSTEGIVTIFGKLVVEVEYAEALGTVGDIALVDLAKYRLIRKGGIEQASSMHVYFSTGEQAFRAFYRADGQMVPRAALTPFKGSATISPAIVLATRA